MTAFGLFLLGLIKGLWSRLIAPLVRWLFADWRNAPLLALALLAANDQLRVKPQLRAERDTAIAQRDAIQKALDDTVSSYRAAAARAVELDAANKRRVEVDQARISQEVSDDYQQKLADVRARALRLAEQLRASPPTNSGGGGATAVPSISAPSRSAAQAAVQDGLPAPGALTLEDALTATEQALQLDALIDWVTRQATVDVNAEDSGK